MTIITFKLPGRGKWRINQDDKIAAGQVIAEVKIEDKEKVIPLSKLLGVPPKKIGKYLLKEVGDKVKPGEILAQKKSLFKKLSVNSAFEGKLVKIDEAGGNLIIEEEGGWQDLISDIAGTVKKLSQDTLELEFEGEVVSGKASAGKKTSGEIKYLGDKIGVFALKRDHQGEIIVAREIDLAAFEKALTLGVGGMVLSQISEENFAKISCGKVWEIGEPCLLSMPVLVVNEAELAKLKNFQGRKAILDPEQKRLILCP